MKMSIEATSLDCSELLTVAIGNTEWNENVIFSLRKRDDGKSLLGAITGGALEVKKERLVSIGFRLDVETARSLAFGFGELAKELGKVS